MEDRYDSLKREAKPIQDENKSLMTALKLLNVNIEMVVMKISRSKNLHDEETPWVTGSDYKTMLRNKKRELQLPVGRKMPARNSTDIASQTINNEQTTVIVGDSIIKNVQGIKLAKTCGTSGCCQAVPRSHNSRHAFACVSPDQICQHVGTNDLKSSTPSDVADAIIDLA